MVPKTRNQKVGTFWGIHRVSQHTSQGTVLAHELSIGTVDHGTNGDRVP
jgi:hypothetical protein